MMLVQLDFACNDPDNGLFNGRCAGIQLADLDLELSANDMRGPVFRELKGAIKISRRVFRFVRSKEWYGNWVWNAYWFTMADAIPLLKYAHSLGAFSADQGDEWLFERWKLPHPFDVRDSLRLRDSLELAA